MVGLLAAGGKRGEEERKTIGRPSFGHRRLPAEGPACTVAGYEHVHPLEPRFLTVEEQAALCSFQASFRFAPRSAAEKEVARGVCPVVGAWFAKQFVASLDANIEVRQPGFTIINHQKPPAEENKK